VGGRQDGVGHSSVNRCICTAQHGPPARRGVVTPTVTAGVEVRRGRGGSTHLLGECDCEVSVPAGVAAVAALAWSDCSDGCMYPRVPLGSVCRHGRGKAIIGSAGRRSRSLPLQSVRSQFRAQRKREREGAPALRFQKPRPRVTEDTAWQ
jgi:hypothetical protein